MLSHDSSLQVFVTSSLKCLWRANHSYAHSFRINTDVHYMNWSRVCALMSLQCTQTSYPSTAHLLGLLPLKSTSFPYESWPIELWQVTPGQIRTSYQGDTQVIQLKAKNLVGVQWEWVEWTREADLWLERQISLKLVKRIPTRSRLHTW